mmetsp:Transcript_17744/g.31697  ORF Transcript_17744/g.31697 Transcript_17744/m.31697 type:complete len:101 (-) Transcript_17744:80-382(-)
MEQWRAQLQLLLEEVCREEVTARTFLSKALIVAEFRAAAGSKAMVQRWPERERLQTVGQATVSSFFFERFHMLPLDLGLRHTIPTESRVSYLGLSLCRVL